MKAQAEVIAEEQAKLIENRLATKSDLEDVRKDIKIITQDITIRVGAMFVAFGTFLVGIKYFGH